MPISRRRLLKLAGAAALLPAMPYVARAQAYPAQPVKFIVGQAAGSSSDITARLITQFMCDKLGQQFVVETRPGAAGNIATEFVTRAAPTATRCSWSTRRTPSTPRSTKSSISIS